MKPSGITETFEYLYRFGNQTDTEKYPLGAEYNIARILRLLEKLGRPHERVPAVLITGTKGKSSTSAMLDTILRRSGIRTGLYISPHVVSPVERISVDGETIAPEEIVEYVGRLYEFITGPEGTGLTFFAIITAIAFDYFAKNGVELAVIEVGMGGRYDATNVCRRVATAITNIGHDHHDKLGDTLEKIAFEKSGIARKGIPMFCGETAPALEVIKRQCEESGAPLKLFGRDWSLLDKGNSFDAVTGGSEYRDLRIQLHGAHQKKNAALAVALADYAIINMNRKPDAAVFGKALAETSIPGRVDLLAERPALIFDAAHTPESADELCEVLDAEYRGRRVVLVTAMMENKDHAAVLKRILGRSSAVVYTSVDWERAAKASVLAEKTRSFAPGEVYIEPDTGAALEIANKLAHEDDVICVMGTFYLAQKTYSFARGLKDRTKE